MPCPICTGVGKISKTKSEQIEEGNKLRAKRLALGYGLREFANKINVLPSDICNLENGKFDIVTMKILGEKYGLQP